MGMCGPGRQLRNRHGRGTRRNGGGKPGRKRRAGSPWARGRPACASGNGDAHLCPVSGDRTETEVQKQVSFSAKTRMDAVVTSITTGLFGPDQPDLVMSVPCSLAGVGA